MPPAVTIRFSPAITSVDAPTTSSGSTPSMRVGIARLADLDDAAVANADVALDDAPVIDDQRIGDHQVERACRPAWRVQLWPMPSRMTLPPPKVISSP